MANDSTRERILDHAESVFALQGFAGARTKAIAQGASVNPAMIHYYFATKEGLFDSVLDRMITELSDIVERLTPAPLSIEEKLEAFFDGYFDYLVRHPNFTRLTKMSIGVTSSKKMEDWIERFFRPLFQAGVAFLKNGIDAGRFSVADPEQFLVSFYCMTVSYFSDADFLSVLLERNALSQESIESRREALKELFFRGLGAVRPTPQSAGQH